MEDHNKTASRPLPHLLEIDWFFRFAALPDELNYMIEEFRRAEYLRVWRKNHARKMDMILEELRKVTKCVQAQLGWKCQYDHLSPYNNTKPMDWAEFNRFDPLKYGWVSWPAMYRKYKTLDSDEIYWCLDE